MTNCSTHTYVHTGTAFLCLCPFGNLRVLGFPLSTHLSSHAMHLHLNSFFFLLISWINDQLIRWTKDVFSFPFATHKNTFILFLMCICHDFPKFQILVSILTWFFYRDFHQTSFYKWCTYTIIQKKQKWCADTNSTVHINTLNWNRRKTLYKLIQYKNYCNGKNSN